MREDDLSTKEKKTFFGRLVRAGAVLALLIIVALLVASNTDFVWDAVGPVYYRDLLIQNGDETGIDPLLVAAMIHVESRFRREARSPVGAIGLMQILPDTGREIAGELRRTSFDETDLYVPELNLQMGFFYLRKLLDHYDGDVNLALAAYNGGIGAVDRWLDQDVRENYDLSNFPKDETVQYVKDVLAAYRRMSALRSVTKTFRFVDDKTVVGIGG